MKRLLRRLYREVRDDLLIAAKLGWVAGILAPVCVLLAKWTIWLCSILL